MKTKYNTIQNISFKKKDLSSTYYKSNFDKIVDKIIPLCWDWASELNEVV